MILGDGSGTQTITAHQLLRDGAAVPHCAYDYESYTNPNPPQEADGYDLLDFYDAVVIIPQQPLVQGSTYTASITLDTGETHTWQFRVAPGFVDAPTGTILRVEEEQ
jgi:hypothetical protein